MDTIKDMKVNNLYTNSLTNNDYQHLYSIKLTKSKYYFIELVSNNENENNLKIYDNKSKLLKPDKKDNIAISKKQMFFSNNDFVDEDIDEDIDEDEDDEYEDEDEIKLNEQYKYNYEYDKYLNDDESNSDENDYEENKSLIEINKNEDFIKKCEFNENEIDNGNQMKFLLYENPEDPTDKIELVIEFNLPESNSSDMYYNSITKILNKKQLIDYNNKLYFIPEYSGEYILSINSDYEGEEGDYSIIIKEVEDISMTSEKDIILNKTKEVFFKKKLLSDKFYIDLGSKKKYNFSISEDNLQVFIFGEGSVFNNNNKLNFSFNTKNGGKYLIEIFSLQDNIKSEFIISEENTSATNIKSEFITSEENTSATNIKTNIEIKDNMEFYNFIIMKDQINDDNYKLEIYNGELKLQKI